MLEQSTSVIRLANSVEAFKAQLKTHLFAKVYPPFSCLWGTLVAAWPRYGTMQIVIIIIIIVIIESVKS